MQLFQGKDIKQIDEFGIDGDLIEAYAFEYLAARVLKSYQYLIQLQQE
ncbi:MAG: hypothetical protein MTP17_02815 [Candidatus Midichloria sp.]|nr:MAG: hypothetical protein MTP17_02815 [Candidatus Midichloria sp.]